MLSIAALNPRIAFDAGRPLYAISCSTGVSVQWAKLTTGSGLFGVYSLNSAARAISGNQLDLPISSLEMSEIGKAVLLQTCR